MSKIKQFESVITGLAGKYRVWDIFRDFSEMSAISLSQAFTRSEKREERYLTIAKKYAENELKAIAELLAITVNALEEKPQDFLGECYQNLGLSNKQNGQFFTPYDLCLLMAKIAAPVEHINALPVGEYITVNEPACGAGANIIALFDHYRTHKVRANRKVFVVAQDIDSMCAHMCYIQLSLLDIPAQVLIGDTLAMTVCEHFNTPACYLHGWNWRLKEKEPTQMAQTKPAPVVSDAMPKVQLNLF